MSQKRTVTGQVDRSPEPLKLYVCTDHDKHQLEAKVASLMWAQNEEQARELLNTALEREGLRGYKMWRYRLELLDLSKPFADILNDGDY
jgi:hypothetical protein